MESEVLLTAIEEHCTSSSNALIDLPAATCLHQSEQVESEEEDKDSPTHCALYKENKCKYNNSTFKPPKNTLWIGCNYPCNAWYHEKCLSLQFAGDKEGKDYTLICPKHKDIKEHFRNKVIALSTDTNSLSDENISLQPMPKRLRLNKKSNVPAWTIDYSIRLNYVEYEGQFYHIAEFLSLQEGKVYRPATSRLARWMESATNDFYEQVEKRFAPQRVKLGLTSVILLHCGYRQRDCMLALSSELFDHLP